MIFYPTGSAWRCMGERRFEVPEAEAKSDRRAHPLVDRPEAAVRIERGPETSLAGPVRREGAVDEDKRWQQASQSDDRFSPFRRRQPIVVGLVTALIALISLAIFLSIAGLDIGQFLIATLVSITVMTLAGCCFPSSETLKFSKKRLAVAFAVVGVSDAIGAF